MQPHKYIYAFRYDTTESKLSKIETRCIFSKEESDKVLFSDQKVEPSSSAFIKTRVELIAADTDYDALISTIKKEAIHIQGFKVEYLIIEGDTTEYTERLQKLRDIGYSIEGTPDYYHPTRTYILCFYEGCWYFGIATKNDLAWLAHKEKPCSYSNSISIEIAKALVNIASWGKKNKILLDACCGAGTIMLEACMAGIEIEGCDINWKLCRDARLNLAHFNYKAKVYRSDVRELSQRYDAAILDLPYNLSSVASEADIRHIIESTAELTDRLVIVSTSEIKHLISSLGLLLLDQCSVRKKGKTKFERQIWVCEKVLA